MAMPSCRAECGGGANREGRRFPAGRASAVSFTGRRGHILIVDDDSDVREVVGASLEEAGYAVTAARNGADALIKLSQMALPQLILLDLAMPQLNGPDFLREMLHDPTYSRIPVIVISGTSLGREAAAAMGADGYLRKPVVAEQLLRALEEALGGLDDEALAPTERQPPRHD